MSYSPEFTIRYARLDEASSRARPALQNWLGEAELRELSRFSNQGRHEQCLAGRWLAKQMLQEFAPVRELNQIQIFTRDTRNRGVRPQVLLAGEELACSLSLSHSDCGVLVAVAKTNTVSLGVDLAGPVPADARFRHLWFTDREREWLAASSEDRAAVLWALKEAIYKAAHRGESWNPRQVDVLPVTSTEVECIYRGEPLEQVAVEIREVDEQIAAIVCLATIENESITTTRDSRLLAC